jgi:hypothetical protein
MSSWTYNVNLTPTNGDNTIANLISTLVTAGWTVPQWSDATTVHTSGTPTATNLSVKFSWARLATPADPNTGQTRELVIQNGSTTSGAQTTWAMKYSPRATFVAFAGSATNAPMALDEVPYPSFTGNGILGPTSSGGSFQAWFATDGSYVQHIVAGGSQQNYSFWMATFTTSSTTLNMGIFFDVPTPWAGSSCLDSAVLYSVLSSTAFTSTGFGVSALSFKGGIQGGTLGSLSGTTATVIAAPSNGIFLIGGLSGIASSLINNTIAFTNFTNAANNGTFQVAEIVSETEIGVYNPGGVYPDTNSGSGHYTFSTTSVQPTCWQQSVAMCPNIRALPANVNSGDAPCLAPMWGPVQPAENRACGLQGYSQVLLFDMGSTSRTNKDLFTVSATGDHIWINGSVLPWPSGTSPS